MIAHNPLHRSRRAALRHRAPALGDDAEASPRIRVANTLRRRTVRARRGTESSCASTDDAKARASQAQSSEGRAGEALASHAPAPQPKASPHGAAIPARHGLLASARSVVMGHVRYFGVPLSEYESTARQDHIRRGITAKVSAGRAVTDPPAGYVSFADGSWDLDPDPAVQAAIGAVFQTLPRRCSRPPRTRSRSPISPPLPPHRLRRRRRGTASGARHRASDRRWLLDGRPGCATSLATPPSPGRWARSLRHGAKLPWTFASGNRRAGAPHPPSRSRAREPPDSCGRTTQDAGGLSRHANSEPRGARLDPVGDGRTSPSRSVSASSPTLAAQTGSSASTRNASI
jgi:hypothetical protein